MFCPKCGAEMADDAEFCSKCGASLNGSGNSQSVTPDNQGNTNKSGKKEKKKGSKKTGIIIAVIAVVLILIVAMSGGNGDDDSVSSGVDLGVLGEDCSLDSLNEENEGATITFTATFWSTRDDSYGYSVSYHPEDEEYGTTFYVKDSTDDKTLSALDDASYEDEIELTITGTYDKTTTFTGSESGSTQTIYYVTAKEAQILGAANDVATEDEESATQDPVTENSETETETVSESAGMTDEEIMADLEWKGYEFDSIDQMRSRLYESEMATYSEEEVAAMTNEEAYWAFCEMMEDYVEENTDETYTIINSVDEFNDWYRYAEVGDTIEVEGLVTSGGESGESIQCIVYTTSATMVYFYVNINDGQRYLNGDVLTIVATLTDETSLLNSYPYFDEVSIILN